MYEPAITARPRAEVVFGTIDGILDHSRGEELAGGKRVGPFGSEDEAEHAKTGCLPWEDDGYVYHVHIEAEANQGS